MHATAIGPENERRYAAVLHASRGARFRLSDGFKQSTKSLPRRSTTDR